MRNLLTRVPKSAQGFVATMVRTIFAQPDAARARGGVTVVTVDCVDVGTAIVNTVPRSDESFGKLLWSNNTLERLNKEIRRRTDVVGIFPNRAAIIRLVGAVLAEQHDEWAVARRYMSADSITKALTDPADQPQEVTAIAA